MAARVRIPLGAFCSEVVELSRTQVGSHPSSPGYLVTVSETLRMTIAYDEQDEDGWIVARVVEVPGAISQEKTRLSSR